MHAGRTERLRAADVDGDPGHQVTGTVASSTSHACGAGRGEQAATGVPLRGVRAGEVRREEFLYELKAGPAGGRLRRPSSAGNDAAATGSQLIFTEED
jgi:hypothetical protein